MIDVVVLTDKRYLADSKTDQYKHNVFYEDEIVVNALENEGLQVLRLAWDDVKFNWSFTKYVLFRTTWDYFDRFQEFSTWLNKVSKQTKLLNSEAIIRWNIDKHYLLDLKQQGVNIAETYFIEQGSSITLKTLLDQLGWKKAILKPCISGAARHTYKLKPDNINNYENIFNELIRDEASTVAALELFLNHNSGSINSNSASAVDPSLSVNISTLAYIGNSGQTFTAFSANFISALVGLYSCTLPPKSS